MIRVLEKTLRALKVVTDVEFTITVSLPAAVAAICELEAENSRSETPFWRRRPTWDAHWARTPSGFTVEGNSVRLQGTLEESPEGTRVEGRLSVYEGQVTFTVIWLPLMFIMFLVTNVGSIMSNPFVAVLAALAFSAITVPGLLLFLVGSWAGRDLYVARVVDQVTDRVGALDGDLV